MEPGSAEKSGFEWSRDTISPNTEANPSSKNCLWPTSPWYFFILIFTIIPILLTSIVYARVCMCVGTSMCVKVHEHMHAHVYRGQMLTLHVFLNCSLHSIVMRNVSLHPGLMDSDWSIQIAPEIFFFF